MSDYKILIVEDEFIEAMSFEKSLKSFGYDVIGIVSTGEEALENITHHKPDLILMDIVLKGDMDGIEAAAKIEEDFDIPIIYLTAHPEESDVKRAKLTSPYGYLIKPVNKTDLKNIIELALYKHQMENELKASEEKYRSWFDDDPTGDFIATSDGRILECNPVFLKIYGLENNQKALRYNISKSNPNDWNSLIKRLKQERKIQNHRSWYLRPDNKQIYVVTNLTGVFNDLDELIQVKGYIFDDTKHEKSEEELKLAGLYNRSLIESSLDPLVTIGADGRINDVNNATEQVTGSSRDDLIGSDFSDYFTEPDKARKGYQQVFKEGFVRDYPLEIKNKNGKITPVLYNASVYQNESGEVIGVFAAARDITERKIAEEELKLNQIRLEMGMEIANLAYWEYEIEKDIFTFNDNFYSLYGTSAQEEGGYQMSSAEYASRFIPPEEQALMREEITKAFETDDPDYSSTVQHNIIRRDGERRVIIVRIRIRLNENGLKIGTNGVNQDVTELIKNEKALKESEERYSLTVEAVNEGFWDWNVPTGEAYFSPIYYNMLGYDDGEFPASYESLRSLIHPDDVEGFEKELQYHIDNAEGYSIEARLKTKDNEWCWILSRGRVVETGEDGKPLRMVGTHTDITDRKIVENVLKESEQRLSEIIEFLPDATFAIDDLGNVISWNRAIEEMTGVKADDILGKGNYEYALPFYGTRKPILIDLVLKSEPELEEKYSLVKKVGKHLLGEVDVYFNGKDHSLWAKAVPLYDRHGKFNGAIESIRDITDRKKAEIALKKSEKRFRAVAESAVDAIVTTDVNGRILYCNDSLGNIFGYSKEEIIGKNLTVLMPDRFKKDYLSELESFKVSGKHRRVGKTLKTLGLRKDGTEFPFEMSLSAWKTGEKSYFTSIIRDITERRQMEDKLYQASKEWERTFDAVPDLIAIIDKNYRISRVNKAMANSLGVEVDDCVGLICYEAVHGSNEPHILCPHKKLLDDGLEHTVEIHLDRLGGDFIVSVSPLHDDEGNLMGSVHVARNITRLKNVEKDLRISIHQKDLLIKEIHHRVKNNLQIISSLLYLQEDYVKEDIKAVNVLQESQNRVSSMALLHEMLYQSEDLSQINFSEYIKNLVSNLFNSYSIKNNITPIINVDNICLNMETAVPCGLIISELVSNSLKYAYPDDTAGELTISLEYLKDELELIISDDGVGFPEDLDFRNIKTSLGLKLVNSLVKQLDGTIKLDSSHGTEFTIKFKELKYKQRI